MTFSAIFNRCAATALSLGCAAVLALSAPSFAQTASAPPAQKAAKASAKKADPKAAPADPAAAQSSIDAGVAAYNAGKTDQAVASLTSALSGGKLPAAQTARALYYRGIAYRKQGKPAQAIADLTSSLWLKNGLGPTERADATAQRSAAYREAGLPDQTDGSAAPKSPPAVIAQPVAPNVKAAPVATAAAPSPSAPTTGVKTAALPSPTVDAKIEQPTSSSNGGGGFFSNLFGGSSQRAPEPPRAAAPQAPQQPQTSGWSERLQVNRAAPPATTAPLATAAVVPTPLPTAPAAAAPGAPRVAAASAPVAKAAPVAVATAASAAPPAAAASEARPADPYVVQQRAGGAGRYQLQVAAVRSRTEAQAVYERIRQKHAKDPGFREAIIDEAAIGGIGTFYRVRLGPYAEANEPRELCAKLRSSGVDCMIVAP
jgi:hypothetical protein